MGFYRKKPVVVEAIQWNGHNLEEIKNFVGNDLDYDLYGAGPGVADVRINTLEGVHHASVLDYIVKGVNGEFYPCKPDIFEKTYDEERGWMSEQV